ncbi:hypothetical protein CDAR_511081 [Caerostris darwini]|uniref:Uncharacterized protein n=1 Tax=Caerostris darwini TaxID=1538125 RepID=A0AAV4S8E0_9ARAC|nr:hypothetical protein CDAR_511081 [Caerostris darwini]
MLKELIMMNSLFKGANSSCLFMVRMDKLNPLRSHSIGIKKAAAPVVSAKGKKKKKEVLSNNHFNLKESRLKKECRRQLGNPDQIPHIFKSHPNSPVRPQREHVCTGATPQGYSYLHCFPL